MTIYSAKSFRVFLDAEVVVSPFATADLSSDVVVTPDRETLNPTCKKGFKN